MYDTDPTKNNIKFESINNTVNVFAHQQEIVWEKETDCN